jgi:ATP-dependent DNA helicase RecG
LERKGFEAFYPSTEKCQHKGLHSKGLSKLIGNLFEQLANQIPETLPPLICTELNLLPRIKALREIHQPSSETLIKAARYRLKWEELFFLQLELLLRKGVRSQKLKGYPIKEVGAAFMEFYEHHLPFELTGAEKRV